MSYNRRIEVGYEMNNTVKISEIKIILDNFENKECPYCHESGTPYLNGSESKIGCDNCEIEIQLVDYIHAINRIVMGWDKNQPKFKKITSF